MKDCCKDIKNIVSKVNGTTEYETYCKKCGKTKKTYKINK